VSLSLVLTGVSATATSAQEAILKATVAETAGVQVSAIRNFVVDAVTDDRRRLSDSESSSSRRRRRLMSSGAPQPPPAAAASGVEGQQRRLAVVAWDVTFDVVAVVSAYDSDGGVGTSGQLQAALSKEFKRPEFATQVSAALGVGTLEVDPSSVVTVLATRNPSLAPSPLPTISAPPQPAPTAGPVLLPPTAPTAPTTPAVTPPSALDISSSSSSGSTSSSSSSSSTASANLVLIGVSCAAAFAALIVGLFHNRALLARKLSSLRTPAAGADGDVYPGRHGGGSSPQKGTKKASGEENDAGRGRPGGVLPSDDEGDLSFDIEVAATVANSTNINIDGIDCADQPSSSAASSSSSRTTTHEAAPTFGVSLPFPSSSSSSHAHTVAQTPSPTTARRPTSQPSGPLENHGGFLKGLDEEEGGGGDGGVHDGNRGVEHDNGDSHPAGRGQAEEEEEEEEDLLAVMGNVEAVVAPAASREVLEEWVRSAPPASLAGPLPPPHPTQENEEGAPASSNGSSSIIVVDM
jgi:hypothetical protein